MLSVVGIAELLSQVGVYVCAVLCDRLGCSCVRGGEGVAVANVGEKVYQSMCYHLFPLMSQALPQSSRHPFDLRTVVVVDRDLLLYIIQFATVLPCVRRYYYYCTLALSLS